MAYTYIHQTFWFKLLRYYRYKKKKINDNFYSQAGIGAICYPKTLAQQR